MLFNVVLDMAVTGKGAFKSQLSHALKKWREMGITDNTVKRMQTKNGSRSSSALDVPTRQQEQPDLRSNDETSLLVVNHLSRTISRVKPRNNATDHIDLYSEEPEWFSSLASSPSPESTSIPAEGMCIAHLNVLVNVHYTRCLSRIYR